MTFVARVAGIALAACLLLCSPRSARAADARVVHVGAYVLSLHAMSLKDNTFTIDFYLWFRWDPAQWKGDPGGEAPKLPFDTFEIVGASEVQKDFPSQTDGYASLRVKAQLTQFWNVEKFPFDNHVLRVVLEDAETDIHSLRYKPDTESSSIAPEFVVPGWRSLPIQATAHEHRYHTTFGDPKLRAGDHSDFSQVVFAIPVVRQGVGMFFKLFTGLFVSVAVALVSFFVRATEVDPRFGLPVGALFAAVASEYVVASALPDSASVTLADELHLVSFVAILSVVVVSARALHLLQQGGDGGEERVARLDRRAFYAVAASWLAAVVGLTLRSL
jgi:hypothetical protein